MSDSVLSEFLAILAGEALAEGLRGSAGGHVHHHFFTRLLSDVHGIQVLGGCACAASYVHRLLSLDEELSDQLLAALQSGSEIEKPGWIQLNLSALMSDDKVGQTIDALDKHSRNANDYRDHCIIDAQRAQFQPVTRREGPASRPEGETCG